jgi:hypothetical protein
VCSSRTESRQAMSIAFPHGACRLLRQATQALLTLPLAHQEAHTTQQLASAVSDTPPALLLGMQLTSAL